MKFLLLAVTACMILSGCYASCATGDPLGLFTYCPKESYEALMHPKPYGAHWIKDGMTRDSRRGDLIACGSSRGEVVEFSHEQINMEKATTEPNGAAAYLRLRNRVGACMQSKGYRPIGDLQYLGGCDARCLYP